MKKVSFGPAILNPEGVVSSEEVAKCERANLQGLAI